jgi:hypothetical protein
VQGLEATVIGLLQHGSGLYVLVWAGLDLDTGVGDVLEIFVAKPT